MLLKRVGGVGEGMATASLAQHDEAFEVKGERGDCHPDLQVTGSLAYEVSLGQSLRNERWIATMGRAWLCGGRRRLWYVECEQVLADGKVDVAVGCHWWIVQGNRFLHRGGYAVRRVVL